MKTDGQNGGLCPGSSKWAPEGRTVEFKKDGICLRIVSQPGRRVTKIQRKSGYRYHTIMSGGRAAGVAGRR